jgi:hypothetical protein
MAIGIFVVLSGEDFNESQNAAIDGKKYPEKTPINIARKIHSVKKRSKNFNRFCDGILLFFNDFNIKFMA